MRLIDNYAKIRRTNCIYVSKAVPRKERHHYARVRGMHGGMSFDSNISMVDISYHSLSKESAPLVIRHLLMQSFVKRIVIFGKVVTCMVSECI